MRIQLTTEPVSIWHGDDRAELGIRSRQVSRLIRQLVWSQQPVEQAEMIRDLRVSDGSKRRGVGDLLTDLRKAMGEEAERLEVVRQSPNGTYFKPVRYRLNLVGVLLDVGEYQRIAEAAEKAIEPYVDDLQAAPESVPPNFDSQLEEWLNAFKAFPVNPGLDSGVFAGARAAYERFALLRSRLVEGIIVGLAVRYLRDGDELWLTQAQTHLDNISGDLTEDGWGLRFRLAGSMSRWKDVLNDLVAQYETIAGEPVADDLAELVHKIRQRDKSAVLDPGHDLSAGAVPADAAVDRQPSSRSGSSVPAANGAGKSIEGALAGLGITHAKELHLKDARMSPVECSRRVIRRLWFSGVMANKWVESEDRHGDRPYEEFDRLLTRLDTESDGETLARLMIVNPWGPKATVLRNRGMLTDQEMKSVPILQDLVKRHPSFEVRMYDTMPLFRMIIVDDQFVTVGPYLNREEVLPDRGWEVPQLVFSPRADFPMSQAFVGMFEEAWHRNKDHPLPFA